MSEAGFFLVLVNAEYIPLGKRKNKRQLFWQHADVDPTKTNLQTGNAGWQLQTALSLHRPRWRV